MADTAHLIAQAQGALLGLAIVAAVFALAFLVAEFCWRGRR